MKEGGRGGDSIYKSRELTTDGSQEAALLKASIKEVQAHLDQEIETRNLAKRIV